MAKDVSKLKGYRDCFGSKIRDYYVKRQSSDGRFFFGCVDRLLRTALADLLDLIHALL